MIDSTRTEIRRPRAALELNHDQASDRGMVAAQQQRSSAIATLAKRTRSSCARAWERFCGAAVSGDRGCQGHKPTVHGVGPPTRELDPDEAATWIDIVQLEGVLDGNRSDVPIALPRLFKRTPSVTSVV